MPLEGYATIPREIPNWIERLGEDIETIINTMPTSNRIPYKNGYGDFLFGRISSWEKKPATEFQS
jgi:hypothetical protein